MANQKFATTRQSINGQNANIIDLTDEVYAELWPATQVLVKLMEALNIEVEVALSRNGNHYLTTDCLVALDSAIFEPAKAPVTT